SRYDVEGPDRDLVGRRARDRRRDEVSALPGRDITERPRGRLADPPTLVVETVDLYSDVRYRERRVILHVTFERRYRATPWGVQADAKPLRGRSAEVLGPRRRHHGEHQRHGQHHGPHGSVGSAR